MNDSSKKRKGTRKERVASRQQVREGVVDAPSEHKSSRPGVDDDSSVVQSMVAALAAPVGGALDSLRERERFAEQGRDLGPDQVGGISGQRAQDLPQVDEPSRERRKLQDSEAAAGDPADLTEERDPGARR